MATSAAQMPPIVSRFEWEKARAELLLREKELTLLKDSVSAERRRLPMVEITESYTFDTENGPVSLLDLFDSGVSSSFSTSCSGSTGTRDVPAAR